MSRTNAAPMAAITLALSISWAGAESAIVGGKSVGISQAPWQLLLNDDCGAVWVGGRNVLTAHHCLDSTTTADTYLWAGITRRSEAKVANRLRVEKIIKKTVRLDYNQDIAILVLAQDITAPLARPIRYATAEDVRAGITDPGVLCAATGWGYTRPDAGLRDSLQRVESKITTGPGQPSGVIRWGAQGGTKEIGACNGDSGGPLVVKDVTGEWILAGLASHLHSYCGNPNQPSSYARVSVFTAWFLENGVTQPTTTPARIHIAPPRSGGYSILDRSVTAVSVLDLQGRRVQGYRPAYPAGSHAWTVAGLPTGAYVLRMQGEGMGLQVAE